LTERGLLKDHQFKRLTKAERAKSIKTLRKWDAEMKEAAQKFVDLDKTNANYKMKARQHVDTMKALENKRIELTFRLQVHYKNSGKNYFRMLHDKIKREIDTMKRFKNMRMDKRWSIRRDNWQVSLGKEGNVVVKQQGMPMKSKSKATLEKMIHKGISAEAKDAFLYDLFGRIERSKRWTRKSPKKGYTRMPNDYDAWGPLANRHVQNPIYKEIMAEHKEMSAAAKVWQRSIGIWKAGKTVWSPRAQFRNFLSNIVLGDVLADVNVSTAIPRHIKSIAELAPLKMGKRVEDQVLKAFKLDTTLMKSSFAQVEIEDAMRWLDPTKFTTAGTTADMLANAFNKALMGPTKLYSLVEEGMKLTIFKDYIKKNLPKGKKLDDLLKVERKKLIRAAEDKANYALFDYGKVPPVIRWARHGYSPFITFTYKAIPRLAQTFARKPWKMVKWLVGIHAVQEAFNSMSGDTPEEIELERRNNPHYMQRESLPGNPSNIRLPMKNKDGMSVYFDLSFIVPWGDFTEGTGDLNMGSRSIMPNNPAWNLYRDFSANEDVFLEKPLAFKHDTSGEVAMKYIRHAWKAVRPGVFDAAIKTADKLLSRPNDWKGRKNSPAQVVADTIFGLKFRNVDQMEAMMFKHRDTFINGQKEMRKEFMQKYTDIQYKRDWEQDKKADEMNKIMTDYSDNLQELSDKIFYLHNAEAEKE
jgi:hypothetical protein